MGFLRDLFRPEQPAPVAETAAGAGVPDVTRTGYEYGVPMGGVETPERARSAGGQRQQIMEQLYQAYLACAPAAACVDTIARMVTAGGLQLVPESGDADQTRPPAIQQLDALMRNTNQQEDLIQLCRSTITDLQTFGDGFIELGTVLDVPAALWTLDGTTMTIECDEHGNISGYFQMVDGQRDAEFTLDEVIHISLDSPRGGVYGVSPMQKLMVPITAWLFTAAVLKEYMRQGAPPRIAVDLGKGTSDVDVERWRQQYAGRNLGPRNQGKPIVTRVHPAASAGAPPIKELAASHIADLLTTLNSLRDQIISGFGMTPAMIGIIESGNLGGGTGESQARTTHYGTVVPLQNLLLEKLNYRLLTRQGITGWKFQFGEVEYRDTATIEAQRVARIHSGQWTVNRARQELGEPPVPGGDVAVVVLTRAIVAVEDLGDASKAAVVKDSGGVYGAPAGYIPSPTPGTAAPAPPTPPDEPALPGGQTQPAPPPPAGETPNGEPAKPRESAPQRDRRLLDAAWESQYKAQRRRVLKELAAQTTAPPAAPKVSMTKSVREAVPATRTGAYVLLRVAADQAAELVVDGGEPAENMHCTLGYLGAPAAEFDDTARARIEQGLAEVWAGTPKPVTATAFATAHFNPNAGEDDDRTPCAVLLIQSDQLAELHDGVAQVLDGAASTAFPIWVPHVTIGYGLTPADIADKVGEITFDALDMVWGDDVTTIA